MGLVHTPRTITSIARGLWKRRNDSGSLSGTVVGIGEDNHHVYRSRLGLFDVDYLGHLNNELARWEMTAYNGMISAMYKNKVNFLVVGTTIRYRKEIGPLFKKFQVDTTVCGLDQRNMWISHKFRLPAENEQKKDSRVMAQMIVQGVAVKGRDVIDPSFFLKDKVGIDSEAVDSVTFPSKHESEVVEEMLARYEALEESMKRAAAEDDTKYS